jgi:hypothetical protein
MHSDYDQDYDDEQEVAMQKNVVQLQDLRTSV